MRRSNANTGEREREGRRYGGNERMRRKGKRE